MNGCLFFEEVIARLGIERSKAYRQLRCGGFPVAEILPRLGRRPRYRVDGEQSESGVTMKDDCLFLEDVIEKLRIPRGTLYGLMKRGEFPFTEIQPRIGRRPRYRASDVARYLANEWQQPRYFGRGRKAS